MRAGWLLDASERDLHGAKSLFRILFLNLGDMVGSHNLC